MNIGTAAPDRHPPTLDAVHPDSVHDVAARLDVILGGLLLLIAAQFRRLGPLTMPLWTRISRARQRLARLLANLAAGTVPKPCAPRPGRPSHPRAAPLPRGHAWVVAILGYHAAGRGAQLNALLADPAMQQAIAAAPSAARTLRPLCRMLGIDLPPCLQPSPPIAAPITGPGAAAPPPRPTPRRRAVRPRVTLREEPAPQPVLVVFPLLA